MAGTTIKGISNDISMLNVAPKTKAGDGSFHKIMAQSLGTNMNTAVQGVKATTYDMQKTAKQPQKSVDVAKNGNGTSDAKRETLVADAAKKNVASDTNNTSVQDTRVEEAAANVKDFIQKKFNISDDELEKIMQDLGLVLTDLLQPSNLTDVVVAVTGKDAVAILTDSDLSDALKSVLDYLNQVVTDLNQGKELTLPQDFSDVLNNVTAGAVEKSDTAVVTDDKQNVEEESTDTESLQDVLASKMTIEKGTEGHDSAKNEQNHFAGRNENPNTDVSHIAGNLAQNIQNVVTQFDTTVEMTRVDSVNIVRQIVDAVKVTANRSLQSIEVQLNPEHLGKVNLTVTARNGVITAEIATQNEQVKRAVESQMTTLKERFEQQGIKVDAVEVTVQSHAFEGGQNLSGNGSAQEKNANSAKKHLNLSSLDDLDDDELSAEESKAKEAVLNENSSVEYSA